MSEVPLNNVIHAKDRSLPIFKAMDDLAARIRKRAYEVFSARGFSGEHSLDDWLAAERELCCPTAELSESGKEYSLSVAVPGFEAADISVTTTPREIIVHASKKRDLRSDRKKDDKETCWSEFQSDEIYRRVELDQAIAGDKVSATLRNGLLVITAAKDEKARRKVPVAAAA